MREFKGSLKIVSNAGVLQYICKGIAFTLAIAVTAVVLGILIGSILALARNYCNGRISRIFKWLAIVYIEVFRNTPLLLWIFVCVVFCPCPSFLNHKMFGISTVEVRMLFKAAVALILFTSSVLAEIIRGGLNSVAQGQFEAGRAQGFHMIQIMLYIVLPQAYRNIVPTLLSQVITTVKDSSYLANVAVIELMARVRQIMNGAHQYNGLGTTNVSDVFVLFGFAALIYFAINFTLSCIVRSLQKRHKRPSVQSAGV
ncbi:MAG: amino acid ABC transporter permease [Muribaculum sp.]|nr:amino acid ABC transporter permease [Muribaculum sp.]